MRPFVIRTSTACVVVKDMLEAYFEKMPKVDGAYGYLYHVVICSRDADAEYIRFGFYEAETAQQGVDMITETAVDAIYGILPSPVPRAAVICDLRDLLRADAAKHGADAAKHGADLPQQRMIQLKE